MGLQKTVFYAVFFILILFNLVSCGYFKPVKNSAEHVKPEALEENKTSELDSKLLTIEQEQTDLKAQSNAKDTLIKTLEEDIKALEKKVAALEKNKSCAKPVKLNIKYPTPEKFYEKARTSLLEQDFVNATQLFEQFIAAYPDNSLADNAAYWLAECHYSLRDYKKAILIFKNIEKQYPKSEKVPDAILKTGYSYLSLNDINRAHHFLKKVLKKYPFSPAAEKAQEKLEDFE